MNPDENRVRLFTEIVADAERKRDEMIVGPVLADRARDDMLRQQAGWPVIIGQKAMNLYWRMDFLHRHPRATSLAWWFGLESKLTAWTYDHAAVISDRAGEV